jgi:hypothetical protein
LNEFADLTPQENQADVARQQAQGGMMASFGSSEASMPFNMDPNNTMRMGGNAAMSAPPPYNGNNGQQQTQPQFPQGQQQQHQQPLSYEGYHNGQLQGGMQRPQALVACQNRLRNLLTGGRRILMAGINSRKSKGGIRRWGNNNHNMRVECPLLVKAMDQRK